MDRKIVIEQAVNSQNSHGEPITTWSTFKEVWADVRWINASERFQSDALHSVRAANFRVRYLPGVVPSMQISFEDLKWRITGIAEIGRREGLDITAEAVL